MTRRRVLTVLFFAYCFLLLWLTIFSREPRSSERVFKWQLLWSYRAWIAGEPYGKTESIQNLNNILVFLPFGFSFPKKKWKPLILTALGFSVVIEAIQYAANLGWCEIDDVVCNVLGSAIGYLLWIALQKMKGKINADT